jgi:signal transduction histidine kinase
VKRDGSEALLVVEDDGHGIPLDVRQRIFDLYFTTKPDGSGLGLALVAQMVGAMGGRVRLDESYQRGARFVVRFPVRKEQR